MSRVPFALDARHVPIRPGDRAVAVARWGIVNPTWLETAPRRQPRAVYLFKSKNPVGARVCWHESGALLLLAHRDAVQVRVTTADVEELIGSIPNGVDASAAIRALCLPAPWGGQLDLVGQEMGR